MNGKRNRRENSLTTYFASDLHFGHENIRTWESENRGRYDSVEEMDADMINQWNEMISEDDTVYYLGDFAFKSKKQEIIGYLEKLNFNKLICVYGNHDNKSFRDAIKQFNNIEGKWADRLKVDGKILYLSHFPMVIGERKDIYSLHGHLHSTESPNINYMLNVGFDYEGKIALSLDETLEKLKMKELFKRGMYHL